MKKFFLGVFIIFDLALMGASVYVLKEHLGNGAKKAPKAFTSYPLPAVTAPVTTDTSTATVKAIGNPLAVPVVPASADSATRKILFTYHNPRSQRVSIRADFTGWKAEPMVKGANGSWTYLAHLTPGEYAYCYTADDKTFKDPANKRTKQIGRTLVSAILVEPPAKPLK